MQHLDNYQSLLAEDLYCAYKTQNLKLSVDQLDYLMCMAIYYMPNYTLDNKLDFKKLWLWYLAKIVDAKNALDPQLEIIYKITQDREKFDVLNNWQRSVIYTYELSIAANLELATLANPPLSEECCPLLFSPRERENTTKTPDVRPACIR